MRIHTDCRLVAISAFLVTLTVAQDVAQVVQRANTLWFQRERGACSSFGIGQATERTQDRSMVRMQLGRRRHDGNCRPHVVDCFVQALVVIRQEAEHVVGFCVGGIASDHPAGERVGLCRVAARIEPAQSSDVAFAPFIPKHAVCRFNFAGEPGRIEEWRSRDTLAQLVT